MKKNILIVMMLAAALAGCSKGGGGGAPVVEPQKTPVGTNDGTAVTKTIGTAGGTVLSDDGEIELIIPAGALAANTDISIQPITNNAPNGRGKAYRCTPDGQQFAKDITIKFHYTEEEAAATKPEYMRVAFQESDGTWKVIESITNDVAGKSISAKVNHFTDFTEFDIMRLVPPSLYLKSGETKAIEISFAGMSTDGKLTSSLAILANPVVWKANGVQGGNSETGTLSEVNKIKQNFKAPASVPAINPVTISAELNIPFVIDGQSFNKGILTGSAYITGNNYGVIIEHEYTFQIGTLEKFMMKDKVSFNIHIVGTQGIVDNLENSTPTITKIAESPAGCVTEFTRKGTGTLHVDDVGSIDVFVNPLDKIIYVSSDGFTGLELPIIRTVCNGGPPGINELPIAFWGFQSFEINDNGQSQFINETEPNSKTTITITPMN